MTASLSSKLGLPSLPTKHSAADLTPLPVRWLSQGECVCRMKEFGTKRYNIYSKIAKATWFASQVMQAAANIRSLRPPSAYKGKGIRYSDEIVKLKTGKKKWRGARSILIDYSELYYYLSYFCPINGLSNWSNDCSDAILIGIGWYLTVMLLCYSQAEADTCHWSFLLLDIALCGPSMNVKYLRKPLGRIAVVIVAIFYSAFQTCLVSPYKVYINKSCSLSRVAFITTHKDILNQGHPSIADGP